jgi:hypothetical protein
MRTLLYLLMSAILTTAFSCSQASVDRFGDSLKGLVDIDGVRQGLIEKKVIEGIKEALEIGTGNAVQALSQVGGYYQNPIIKILLPEALQKSEKLLRAAGYGQLLDAFELSMNQAAEKAAPAAKEIFWNAIKEMTISDAQKLLEGSEDEATLYFKDKTYSQLSSAFKPLVRVAMSEVGVTRRFQQLDDLMKVLPFTESLGLDLDQYVNDKALDGLFWMLAEEERKIRQDPSARVTELLRQVFGSE